MHNSQFVPLSSLVKMIKDDVCGNSLKLSYTLPRLKDLETLVDVLAIVLRASDSTEVSIIGTDKKVRTLIPTALYPQITYCYLIFLDIEAQIDLDRPVSFTGLANSLGKSCASIQHG